MSKPVYMFDGRELTVEIIMGIMDEILARQPVQTQLVIYCAASDYEAVVARHNKLLSDYLKENT